MRIITFILSSLVIIVTQLAIYPANAAEADVFDIDGNSKTDALTDGLLVLRYQFGFRGGALINGAVANDATRKTASQIEAYINAHSIEFDIDGNNKKDALSDGLLLLRYMFGFRGGALTNGAVADDATRKNAAQIEAYIVSGNGNGNGGGSDINHVPGVDLSTASATLNAITNINNLQKINATWLQGEWASYDPKGISHKISFTPDGKYQHESTTLKDGKTSVAQSTGKWRVYEKTGTQRYYLYLTDDTNPYSLQDFPVEPVGTDAFRLVNQYKYPVSRSILYSRLNDPFTIYPGMNFIGTFENTLAYIDSDLNYHTLYLTFNKDGSLKFEDYDVTTDLDGVLTRSETGTWRLDTQKTQLIIRLDSDTADEIFTILSTSYRSFNWRTQHGGKTYWTRTKTGIIRPDYSAANMQGEYQAQKDESYFSIRRNGQGYIVDYIDDSLDFLSFKNVPAEQLDNGDLSLTFPPGHFNAGKPIILRAGYNRLVRIKGFALGKNFQKVSKYPVTQEPVSVLGGWRNAIFSASGFMNYVNFYKDGTFKASQGYGKYTVDSNNKITMKKTCESPKTYNPSFADHRLGLNVPYSPLPGLRDWGDEGSEVGQILFKHALDAYQTAKSPRLKPYPGRNGAYLFQNETHFRALLTSSDFISYTLKPDGTGTYHAGNIGLQGLGYSDQWVTLPGFGLSYGIKYFIVQQGDKEYIVYYPSGYLLVQINNFSSTYIDQIKAANGKNIRVVELYHRRTAICEHDSTDSYYILPLDN